MLFCSPNLISKIRSNPTCPEGNFLGYPVSFEAVKNLIKEVAERVSWDRLLCRYSFIIHEEKRIEAKSYRYT